MSRSPHRKYLGALALFLFFSAALWAAKPLFIGWQDKATPSTIFQNVLGQPMPDGISNLKVIARGFAIKRWAWMSFSATDEALKQITQNEKLLEEPQLSWKLSNNYAVQGRYDAADKRYVNWREPAAIARKEVYEITGFQEGWMWGGYMMIDKDNRMVYIHAGDL